MKRFIILSADVAMNKAGEQARVVLNVQHDGKIYPLNRTCNQTLHDLQKSGRGLSFPASMFANGVDSVPYDRINAFRSEVIQLANKEAVADVAFYEMGAEYEATETNTAVVNGEAEVGDILQTKKAGGRIEGFINIPLSQAELLTNQLMITNPGLVINALLGLNVVAPVKAVETVVEPVITNEISTIQQEVFNDVEEPFGQKPKATKKVAEPAN